MSGIFSKPKDNSGQIMAQMQQQNAMYMQQMQQQQAAMQQQYQQQQDAFAAQQADILAQQKKDELNNRKPSGAFFGQGSVLNPQGTGPRGRYLGAA